MIPKMWLGAIGISIIILVIYMWKRKSLNSKDEKNSKIKVVLFYKDGCPPCENLKPIWNELVDHLDGEEIVFSKIDVMKYSVKGITHTPTIWVRSEDQTFQYDGERNFEDMKSFILNFVKK